MRTRHDAATDCETRYRPGHAGRLASVLAPAPVAVAWPALAVEEMRMIAHVLLTCAACGTDTETPCEDEALEGIMVFVACGHCGAHYMFRLVVEPLPKEHL
jgi:hypothetical protein